jgi:predicted aspartyl protease
MTVAKKDQSFVMANGQTITRSVGYAVLRAAGFETVDEVVFAEPGDLNLLGSRTLEGFGATVDSRRRKLVAAGPHPAATG